MPDDQARWPRDDARPRRAGEGPKCGRCGYPVRGLPTFTCPECGGDLREVGIRRPGRGGLWAERGRFAAEAARGVLRAAAAVARLRGPSVVHERVVEVTGTGRVVFDPPLAMPPGRRRAVIVWAAPPGDEGDEFVSRASR